MARCGDWWQTPARVVRFSWVQLVRWWEQRRGRIRDGGEHLWDQQSERTLSKPMLNKSLKSFSCCWRAARSRN